LRSETCGSAARTVCQTPSRSTSITRSHSSAGAVRKVAVVGGAIPAFAIARSRQPKRSTAAATAAIIAPESVTSAASPIALSPIRSAASPACSASRSTTATEAPRSCIWRALSKPIPRAAPVTSATFPLRS
jgi:hypothetical protein